MSRAHTSRATHRAIDAIGAALLCGLLGSLSGACTVADIDPMKVQAKYKPYGVSEFFEDGRAMRRPPEGTVPRERLAGSAAVREGISPDGRPVDEIPVPVTSETIKRGQKRFNIHCAVCHGKLGDGVSIVATKMSLRPPPSLVVLRDRPAGHFYKAITEGFGLMNSYAADIPIPDRWAVVAYIRALQLSQNARLDELPESIQKQVQEQHQESNPDQPPREQHR